MVVLHRDLRPGEVIVGFTPLDIVRLDASGAVASRCATSLTTLFNPKLVVDGQGRVIVAVAPVNQGTIDPSWVSPARLLRFSSQAPQGEVLVELPLDPVFGVSDNRRHRYVQEVHPASDGGFFLIGDFPLNYYVGQRPGILKITAEGQIDVTYRPSLPAGANVESLRAEGAGFLSLVKIYQNGAPGYFQLFMVDPQGNPTVGFAPDLRRMATITQLFPLTGSDVLFEGTFTLPQGGSVQRYVALRNGVIWSVTPSLECATHASAKSGRLWMLSRRFTPTDRAVC